jgi:hypothetical protein
MKQNIVESGAACIIAIVVFVVGLRYRGDAVRFVGTRNVASTTIK